MPALSPAPRLQQVVEELPLKMIGGSNYGRYPKISIEQTWNFLVSDGALVPYAGYQNVLELDPDLPGRGIYASFRGGFMIAAIGSQLFKITVDAMGNFSSQLLNVIPTGSMVSVTGDVYIAENNNSQIAITDGQAIYVYDYSTPSSTQVASSIGGAAIGGITFPTGYFPGYISFQNGVFIVAILGTNSWLLSAYNQAVGADAWLVTSQTQGSLQTKPDYVQACVPVPGGGNNLLVFGRNVAELWQFTGAALFPYQRASTTNSDYGCINAATISALEKYIVWIAVNEQSGPVLMVSTGTEIKSISTDGIDYTLGNLTNPTNCTGFLFQQDGHLIYQFTFPTDNISFAYDFNTKLFFNVSDENLNYHIARQIVYFNDTYYFVSLNGGNIYGFDTLFTNAQYSAPGVTPVVMKELPRIRICPPIRLPSQRYFIGKSLGFTIEQGQVNMTLANGQPSEAVDLSASYNGGNTFGNAWRQSMYPTGQFKSRFIWQQLGIINDVTFQLRFYGYNRFVVVDDGICEVFQ